MIRGPGGVDRPQNEGRIQAQHPLTPPKKKGAAEPKDTEIYKDHILFCFFWWCQVISSAKMLLYKGPLRLTDVCKLHPFQNT